MSESKPRLRRNLATDLLLAWVAALLIPAATFGQDLAASALTPDSTFELEGRKPAVRRAAPEPGMVNVIVKLRGDPLVRYRGGLVGLRATSPRATGHRLDLRSSDSRAYLKHLGQRHDDLEARVRGIPGARVNHRFDVILNGLALTIPTDRLGAVKALPGVEAVYPDQLLHVDTDRSPQFIGAPTVWNETGGQETGGEGVVVGVLDTGIWPEHPSFSDPDPAGKPYAAPPASWTGTACQFGSAVSGDVPFTCNHKLIGARRFMATYDAATGIGPGEFPSARDDDGHGTHTSSTAAGNARVQATIFGVSRGRVSGIAPRAHVAMYKVCGAAGCYGSDSAAAVQQAIRDGVNVINFSISGGRNPYSDAVSLAFLDAYAAGIFVAASAGNSGPGADTTDHREPWVTTVAASTENRAFENTVLLTAGGGATLTLTGASITGGIATPKSLFVPTADPLCLGPFAAGTLADLIVVCRRGTAGRVEKGFNVLQGGAAGMILYNQSASVTDVETDNHFLPVSHVQFADGQALLAFLAANTGVQATLTAGVAVASDGDVMASFSSRGGPGQTLGVSKPDITAPGVQILAGHTPLSADTLVTGPQGQLFQAIAGTSMSSPHIAGAAAALKALYPSWTPGKIRSAIMTTAKAAVVKEDGVTPATPFDDGTGRVELRNANYPKGTFDASAEDFIAHQADLWNVNYPSLYVPVMPGSVTVQRTIHNEHNDEVCWVTSVKRPADLKVTVPDPICVPVGGDTTFDITVDARAVPIGEVRHATLVLTVPGTRTLRLPITIVRKQPAVTLAKACDPTTFPRLSTTACQITAVNTSFSDANVLLQDVLPNRLQLDLGSVVGATSVFDNQLAFSGTLAGAEPPNVSIAPGTSPAGGYLGLSLFGIAPIAGVGDDTITNFNVPAFVYAGETYTRIGVASNGYLVVGGGTSADIAFMGQNLPNPAAPNNVLAPFWTDLNPGAGGAIRIGTLTDGVHTWIVVDWAAVKEFSTTRTDSFEVWIGTGGVEDISYAYGPIGGNGDLGFLTVGAENRFGNRGANAYYNGTGTLPANGTQLRVSGAPSAPGETKTVTFSAKGRSAGPWTNCATLDANIFFGTNIACTSGQVTP